MLRNEATRGTANSSSERAERQQWLVSAPALSLPNGGGALRGIGEKFSTTAQTGTANFEIPIPGERRFWPEFKSDLRQWGRQRAVRHRFAAFVAANRAQNRQRLAALRRPQRFGVFVLHGEDDLVPALMADGRPDELEHRILRTAGGCLAAHVITVG